MSGFTPLAALTGAGFRRYTAYRAAMIGGAFTNAVFGLLRASVLVATLHARGGPVGGHRVGTAETCAWGTLALNAVVEWFTWNEIAQRVRTGAIPDDLSRAADPQVVWAAADLG